MDEFLKIIFGDFTFIQLFGYLWFFIIGYLIYGLTEVTGRDVQSPATPKKWSWKFWFYDNWRRYLTTLLCTYVLFRFYTEISGHPFGYIDAVTLGMIGDGVAATIKERVKAFAGNREQLTTQIKKELGEIG
jgi:hypothetical protein